MKRVAIILGALLFIAALLLLFGLPFLPLDPDSARTLLRRSVTVSAACVIIAVVGGLSALPHQEGRPAFSLWIVDFFVFLGSAGRPETRGFFVLFIGALALLLVSGIRLLSH